MALRLLKYTMLLLERHSKKKNKLPLVLPIIFYAGKKKYDAPQNLWDLFQHPDLAKEILTNDYKLINLKETPDDEITKKKHLALFEYAMKHIHTRDMLKLWQNIFANLKHAILIDEQKGFFYITRILWYTDTKLEEENEDKLKQLILDNLAPQEGDKIMRTIADKYIELGVAKGITQGIAQGEARGVEIERTKTATKMFQQGLDIKLIADVTGLPTDKLLKIKSETKIAS